VSDRKRLPYAKVTVSRYFGKAHIKVRGEAKQVLSLAIYGVARIAADIIHRCGPDAEEMLFDTINSQVRYATRAILERDNKEDKKDGHKNLFGSK
jgi:hypothetical protein